MYYLKSSIGDVPTLRTPPQCIPVFNMRKSGIQENGALWNLDYLRDRTKATPVIMDLPDLRARLMEPKEYLISNMFLYSNAVDTKHTPVALKNGYKTNVLYMERHSDYRQENIPDI